MKIGLAGQGMPGGEDKQGRCFGAPEVARESRVPSSDGTVARGKRDTTGSSVNQPKSSAASAHSLRASRPKDESGSSEACAGARRHSEPTKPRVMRGR
jgi:hypothetical protein